MLACYFPQGAAKIPVFEFVIGWAAQRVQTPALIIGDLNTGKHLLDEVGKTFVVPQYLERLEAIGFVDGWRLFHRDAREFTWFSSKGNGFRVDHVFLSPQLIAVARQVRYSHKERLAGISDHSVLLAEIELNEVPKADC
jgi:exonuclease III